MINQNQKQLLNYLLKKGVLRENQLSELDAVLHSSPKLNLRQILVNGGFVDSEKLARVESDFWKYPFIIMTPENVKEQALETMPCELAENSCAICFDKDENKLKIALASPDDYSARGSIDSWAEENDYVVSYFFCSLGNWKTYLRKVKNYSDNLKKAIAEVDLEDEIPIIKRKAVIKSAPGAKILTMIVKQAIQANATDIHFEPSENLTRVRFRVNGILQTVLNLPENVSEAVNARIKILADLDLEQNSIPQEGRFIYEQGSESFNLRVSLIPFGENDNEKAVIQIVDNLKNTLSLQQLGLNNQAVVVLEKVLKQANGFVLITSPDQGGKSTTLSTLLSMLNKEGLSICTLESPVECNITGVNQIQVRPEINFTFASGLRALLRQDSDVILVGDLQDMETAEMLMHASLTGHLMFSGFHAKNVIDSIARILEMQVEPFLLASSLNVVVCQDLVRRVCPHCKEAYELPEAFLAEIKKQISSISKKDIPKELDLKNIKGYRGAGCAVCKGTGFVGKVVISEALPITEKVKNIISQKFNEVKLREDLGKIKIMTMQQDGLIKALRGVVAVEDILEVKMTND